MRSEYEKSKYHLKKSGFIMGRSRVAALSEDHNGRSACNLSNNCLWGCSRNSLYISSPVIARNLLFSEIIS